MHLPAGLYSPEPSSEAYFIQFPIARAKLADRLSGLQAELQMDYEQLAEILQSVRQNMNGQIKA